MKDHFKIFSWLLFIASGTSSFAASVYIPKDPEDDALHSGSSRDLSVHDERAIVPRIGQHARVFPVCEYSYSVGRTDLRNLVKTYQFNQESAQCFLNIRDNEYSPFVDKSSEAFQHRVQCSLIACESLSAFISANNKAEIVCVLNKLLQRRYDILNYVLPLARVCVLNKLLQKRHGVLNYVLPPPSGHVSQDPEFSLYFPNASSVQETFMHSLTNMVDGSLEIKMSQELKDQFSTLDAWKVILSAFSAHNDVFSSFGGSRKSDSCCTVV
jgi:hypothetical protein